MTTEVFPAFEPDFLQCAYGVSLLFHQIYNLQTRVDDLNDYIAYMSALIRISLSHRRKLTSWLQASTTDKETIDIFLLGQVVAVPIADAASVDDTGVVRDCGRDGFTEPFANSGVNFLGLSGGGNLTGSNGPAKVKETLDI